MNKPEKKKEIEKYEDYGSAYDNGCDIGKVWGYNEACEDWEKFLPSKDEIIKIIRTIEYIGMIWTDEIAKAIAERIGK